MGKITIEQRIKSAQVAISAADALLITAGAGMGVDSGLPDFRGDEGFWRAYPALKGLGISFNQMASPEWFANDPQMAWAFYGHRLNLYRQTDPHAGFELLRRVAESKAGGYFVFTSNVDGHFQKAGFDPAQIVECHGSIHRLQCIHNCQDYVWSADRAQVRVDMDSFKALDIPRCPHCSSVARPNIVMFGDWHVNDGWIQTQEARFKAWVSELGASLNKVAVIELGAGTAIPTVRRTSEWATGKLHGKLIRINPNESEVPAGHIGLALGAKEGIGLLARS